MIHHTLEIIVCTVYAHICVCARLINESPGLFYYILLSALIHPEMVECVTRLCWHNLKLQVFTTSQISQTDWIKNVLFSNVWYCKKGIFVLGLDFKIVTEKVTTLFLIFTQWPFFLYLNLHNVKDWIAGTLLCNNEWITNRFPKCQTVKKTKRQFNFLILRRKLCHRTDQSSSSVLYRLK